MNELLKIKGIGKISLEHLIANQINCIEDLVNTFPSKYSLNEIKSISDRVFNEEITLQGILMKKPVVQYIRRKLTKMKLQLRVENISIEVSIFNREFLKNNLFENDLLVISGRFQSNVQFIASDIVKKSNYLEGIIPEYKLSGISSKLFSKWVDYAIQNKMVHIQETIPDYLLKKNDIIDQFHFFQMVHHPLTLPEVESSKRRIKYEELLSFFLKLEMMKALHKQESVESKNYDIVRVKEFIDTLPFELTEDQKNVTNDIFRDLKKNKQMNRLLQGDTGAGKTVCAAIAIYAVVTANQQIALMAPTELLAMQHMATFQKYLSSFHVNIAFLSSKITGEPRNRILRDLKTGKIDLLVGTHSLIQENVEYHKLGFVVIDEQHRFGVAQRKSLREKGLNPDVLFMSATPIPRTLAITIFRDMDISSIRMMPSGRKPVQTQIVEYEDVESSFKMMNEQLSLNHQAYVVVPLIEENEESRFISIDEALELVESYVPKHVKTAIMHGKMKSFEKETTLNKFYQNEIQVLVSTTVVEVGLNVPNATFMMILNASRFGLSQLHQLRGRVGRSNHQAFCHLINDGFLEDENRLEILCVTNDGFVISEADLQFRGPGQIFGEEQTGIPKFKMANFMLDQDLIASAIEDASVILSADDECAKTMRNKVGKSVDSYHLD